MPCLSVPLSTDPRGTHRFMSLTKRGDCLWRGKALTNPAALAETLAPFADDLAKIGLGTGCWRPSSSTSCGSVACRWCARTPGSPTRSCR